MSNVYNLIRLPILAQGYRYFSDAPPDMGVVLANAISSTLETDGQVYFREFQIAELEGFLIIEMRKFSSQSDEDGRPGLQYYHIVAIDGVTAKGHVNIQEQLALFFQHRYNGNPADEIEKLLRFSREQSPTDISEIFRAHFFSDDDVDRFLIGQLSVKTEKSPSPEKTIIAPQKVQKIQSEVFLNSLKPRRLRARKQSSRYEKFLLILCISLLTMVLVVAVETGGLIYFHVRSKNFGSSDDRHTATQIEFISETMKKILNKMDEKEPPPAFEKSALKTELDLIKDDLKSIKDQQEVLARQLTETDRTTKQLINNNYVKIKDDLRIKPTITSPPNQPSTKKDSSVKTTSGSPSESSSK